MSTKFKAMKFWIGDDEPLHKKLTRILNDMGYVQNTILQVCEFLVTREDGTIWNHTKIGFVNAHHIQFEEINIDWMRTPKEETVELNGKKYLKSELEEALKHINPMD